MSLSVPVSLEEVGNAVYSNLSASKSLTDAPTSGDTLPADANYALFTVDAQAVHFSFDGDDATTNDQKIPSGTVLSLDNCRTLLTKIEMIEASATANVYVTYFKGPQG